MVVLASRDLGRGDAARAGLLLAQPGWADRLTVVQLDVTSDASVAAAAAAVKARFGSFPLYGLVNNAGIATAPAAAIFETNLVSVKRVTDAFLPLLRRDGRIVNVSSGAAAMFVAKCSPKRIEFFKNERPTWAAITAAAAQYSQLRSAAAAAGSQSPPPAGAGGGTEPEEESGFPPRGEAMGAYGCSKASRRCPSPSPAGTLRRPAYAPPPPASLTHHPVPPPGSRRRRY